MRILQEINAKAGRQERSFVIRTSHSRGPLYNIKMNRLLIFSLLSIYPLLGFCQDPAYSLNTNKLTESDSLYLIAIEKFTIEIDSFYNKYGDKDFEDKLYIAYNDYLNNLPDTVNGYKIILLGL